MFMRMIDLDGNGIKDMVCVDAVDHIKVRLFDDTLTFTNEDFEITPGTDLSSTNVYPLDIRGDETHGLVVIDGSNNAHELW